MKISGLEALKPSQNIVLEWTFVMIQSIKWVYIDQKIVKSLVQSEKTRWMNLA